jgi:hypothetical protein
MRSVFVLVLLTCGLIAPAAAQPPASTADLSAPRLSERSLLLPGLWWDPQHVGQGFDLHLSGNTLGMVWYTFKADGTPVWYLASGELDENGTLQASLLRTRWEADTLHSEAVGEVRLQRTHAEAARLDWSIAEQQGTYLLEPFQLTAQRAEVDPSGAYHDPARSGFGLSLDQQGDGLSAIYYLYDQAGQPTWRLGYRSEPGVDFSLEAFAGPCPGCPTRDVQVLDAVATRISVEGADASLQFATGSELIASPFRQLEVPLQRFTLAVADRQADFRLARFDDAGSLRAYLIASILDERHWGGALPPIDFSPPPPPVPLSVSSTNLIVEGVDEPDLVKSDGDLAYALATEGGSAVVRIVGLGAGGTDPRPLGAIALPFGHAEQAGPGAGLFLADDKLVHVATDDGDYYGIDICPPPPFFLLQLKTRVSVLDRHAHGGLESRWQAEIDGYLVDSRRIGDQLYLVMRYASYMPGFRYNSIQPADREHNAALLAAQPLEYLLPKLRINGEETLLFEPDAVYLPPSARQEIRPDFVNILRINLDDPEDRETIAIVGGIAALHVSGPSLFLTSSRYTYAPDSPLRQAPTVSTDVHRIDLADGGLRVASSGSVDGLLNGSVLQQPFRLSERDGLLRIVTEGQFGSWGRNRLSVLAESSTMPGLLKTVSQLPNRERPAPIGKPGELLHATRFSGNRLFAVTFQQTDPLYVIDLSDPEQPAIRGELEVPGFSDYLHPFSDDLLLGVGFHVPDPMSTPGLQAGVKLSLFDVSDSAQPRVIKDIVIGQRGTQSAVFRSHRAFSVLPLGDGRFRFALPLRVHGQADNPPEVFPGWGSAPFTHSALYAFDLDTGGGALEPLGKMIVNEDPYSGQLGDLSARSLLTPEAALLWRGGKVFSAPWQNLQEPVGPR